MHYLGGVCFTKSIYLCYALLPCDIACINIALGQFDKSMLKRLRLYKDYKSSVFWYTVMLDKKC